MVWIKYFIPEDGDDIQHPNLFQVEGNSGEVTLAQVVEGFPLPGRYHFRFLRSLGGAGGGAGATVWMDLPQPSSVVPSYQGSVLAKVSRLVLSSSGSGGGAAAVTGQRTSADQVPVSKPPRPAAPPAPPAPAAAEPSEKLLNFHDDDLSPPPASLGGASASSAPAPSIFDSSDLLGMGATASNPLTASLPPPATASGAATPAADPFGLQTLQPTTQSMPMGAAVPPPSGQQRFYPSRPMASSMGSAKAMGGANGAYDPFQGLGATNPSSSSYRR